MDVLSIVVAAVTKMTSAPGGSLIPSLPTMLLEFITKYTDPKKMAAVRGNHSRGLNTVNSTLDTPTAPPAISPMTGIPRMEAMTPLSTADVCDRALSDPDPFRSRPVGTADTITFAAQPHLNPLCTGLGTRFCATFPTPTTASITLVMPTMSEYPATSFAYASSPCSAVNDSPLRSLRAITAVRLETPVLMNGTPVQNEKNARDGPAVVRPRWDAYPTSSAYAISWGTDVAAIISPDMRSATGLHLGIFPVDILIVY
mmetsp:Transcript_26380/g.52558  ORF Transcript_26380/g.52558 Transcript_26380/m.52558 type:complete len:257 (+) Transcript_26380:694-1464(+)